MTLAPPNPPLHDEVVRLTPLAPEHVVPMRALGDDGSWHASRTFGLR